MLRKIGNWVATGLFAVVALLFFAIIIVALLFFAIYVIFTRSIE